MRVFVIIWLGQLVSLFGSALTRFALGVWVYTETGSTTSFALTLLVTAVPELLLLPIAGSLADRWDRRRLLLLADIGSAVCVLALALVLSWGQMPFWAVNLALACGAIFTTIQWPALTASISQLVPSKQLSRANGMMQLAYAASQVAAPLFAGHMLGIVGLRGLAWIDFATYLIAIGTLLFVRFAPAARAISSQQEAPAQRLLADVGVGWTYILERPGLTALLILYALLNFTIGMIQTLLTPLVLSFAPASELGSVMTAGGLGVLVGSLVMSAWGGPKRRVRAVLFFMITQAFILCVCAWKQDSRVIAAAAFLFLCLSPLADGCSQALWQSRVKLELQGRVFAVRRLLATAFMPLAYAISGPLDDRIFEPLLAPGGPLAPTAGVLFGVGPGRGTALLMVMVGLCTAIVAAGGFLYPRLRRLEDELPDVLPTAPVPYPNTVASG